MKKLLTFIALLSVPILACADDAAKLIIKQKSGNETVLSLSSNPLITFVGENMKVENEFITISIPIEDIDDYRVDNPERVNELPNKPIMKNGHVLFTGLPNGTTSYVYTIDGKTAFIQKATNDGRMDIDIDSLPKGTYIVKTLNNTIKVTTK